MIIYVRIFRRALRWNSCRHIWPVAGTETLRPCHAVSILKIKSETHDWLHDINAPRICSEEPARQLHFSRNHGTTDAPTCKDAGLANPAVRSNLWPPGTNCD